MNLKDDIYKERYKIFFIAYFSILVGIAFLRVPDLRNEFKYFVVTDEMINTKNFLILRYFNELYPDKPPIYFWILGIFRLINKENFYPLSLIFGGIIPAAITAKLGFEISKLYWTEKMAYVSTTILITLPYLFGISLVLRMDYLMTMFIMLSLYSFFKVYKIKKGEKISLLKISYIYISIGFGILVKGGAAVVVPLLTILTFLYLERNLKFLKKIKPIFGISLILGILSIFFLSIYSFEDGKEYIKLMLGQETIDRMVKSKTHTKPVYHYIKNLIFTALPLTIFLVRGVIDKFKNIKMLYKWKPIDKISFSLFIPNLIFFSLLSGKLDIYLLPLYYGIVTISLRFIEREWSGTKEKICKKILYVNLAVLAVCLLALPYYNKNYTIRDSIEIIKLNTQEIYSYRFGDVKNILSEIDKNEIKEMSLNELNLIKEGELLIARKKYYKDIPLQNFKEIYSNKEYIILIRE
ncbi:ArnT family glycosyltransferase [Cetobacterium sp.]|uniref:ArnT family glycosyltransferase n=1 Tax=Cetobacterium sp. TaxID=2071632 RepID=UPI003F3BCC15